MPSFLFSATVSVEVSLGTKLAQAEEECWDARALDSVTILDNVFRLSQSCCMHLITLPTHLRLLKLRHKTDYHLTWQRSADKRHRKWSQLTVLEIRGSSSSSRILLQQGGMVTSADFRML